MGVDIRMYCLEFFLRNEGLICIVLDDVKLYLVVLILRGLFLVKEVVLFKVFFWWSLYLMVVVWGCKGLVFSY